MGEAQQEKGPIKEPLKDSVGGALIGLLALLFLFVPVHPLRPASFDASLGEDEDAQRSDVAEAPGRSNLGAGFDRDDRADPGSLDPPAPEEAAPLRRASAFSIEVKRADGSPAEGASVDLMGSALGSSLRFRSDERGHVETPKLPAGFYELHAHHGSLVSRPLLGVQLKDDEPKDVELILRSGQRLEGEVVRHRDGAPIEGARLIASPDALSLIRREAVTDARGRFVIEGLHEGESTLHVEAAGYTREGPLRVDPSRGELNIRLGLATSIEILIRDERGRPVEEAEVLLLVEGAASLSPIAAGERLSVIPGPVPPIPARPSVDSAGSEASEAAGLSILASGETDARGLLLLEGLPQGRVTLRAEADGSTASLSDPIELIPGRRAEASLTLKEGGSLALRVRDEHGDPARRARIRAEREGDPFPLEILSDENGEIELHALDGRYRVRAIAGDRESPELTIRVRAGERREAELRFESRGDALSGRIIDARGFGVSSALITLSAEGEGRSFEIKESAARDGTFRFEDLPPPPYSLRVEHPGYPARELRGVDQSGELDPITLELGGAIRGEVMDERSGEGLRAKITIRSGGLSAEVMSDSEGSFTADQLPLGRASLRVEAEGYLPITRELTIERADRALAIGALRLDRAASIQGEIVDRYGEPIFGAELTLEGSKSPSAKSDEAGRFLVEGLPPGSARLMATLRDGTRHLHRGALQLRSGETIEGVHFRITHHEEPAPELPARPGLRYGVAIEVADSGGAIEIRWVAEESAAEKAGLRVGDQILAIDGEEFLIAAQARAALRVGEGEEIAIRLRREGGARTLRISGERYLPPD